MTVQGHSKDYKECLGDGISQQDGLLRFVHGPDGRIWFDPSGKAMGDAVFVRPEREIFNNVWDLGLIGEVLNSSQEDSLKEQTLRALYNRLLQSLGLAKKSSQLVLGQEKIKEALKNNSITTIISVNDAGKSVSNWLNGLSDVAIIKAGDKLSFSTAVGVANCTVIGLKATPNSIVVLKAVRKCTAFAKDN